MIMLPKSLNHPIKGVLTTALFLLSQISFASPPEVVKEIYDQVNTLKASVIYQGPIEAEALLNDSYFQQMASRNQIDKTTLEKLLQSPEFLLHFKTIHEKMKSQNAEAEVMEFLDDSFGFHPSSVYTKHGLFINPRKQLTHFKETIRRALDDNKMSESEFISCHSSHDTLVPIRAIQETVDYLKQHTPLNDSALRRLGVLIKQFIDQALQNEEELSIKQFGEKTSESHRKKQIAYWNEHLFDQSGDLNLAFLRLLKTELPIDEIEKTFYKYGVIQLRPLKSEMLLPGCGNLPLQIGNRPHDCSIGLRGFAEHQDFFTSYQQKHSHEEFDTIDPDIRMNPTVVGFLGSDKVTAFFLDQGKRYREIPYEDGDMNLEKVKEKLLIAPSSHRFLHELKLN